MTSGFTETRQREERDRFEKSVPKLVIQNEIYFKVMLKMYCFNVKVIIYSYTFLPKITQ